MTESLSQRIKTYLQKEDEEGLSPLDGIITIIGASLAFLGIIGLVNMIRFMITGEWLLDLEKYD